MAFVSSESDFNVKIEGIDGLWATRTGGDAPLDVSLAFNGGDRFPTPVVGKEKPSQLICSRPFQPERDQPLIRDLKQRKGVFRPTIYQIPTFTDGVVVGGDDSVWTECVLTNVKDPDTNAGSSNSGMVELTFQPTGVL